MGMFSSKKTTVGLEPMLTEEQKKAQSLLSSFSQTGKVGDYQAGTSYDKPLGVYERGATEQAGANRLSDMMGAGQSDVLGLARDEIRKTLSGGYDPTTSGYYQPFKREVMKQSGEQSDAMKRNLAITGDLYGTEFGKQQRQLGEETSAQLTGALQELAESERQRRLGAAQSAYGLEGQAQNQEMQRIGASMEAEREQRMLQDAEARDKYSEWQRGRSEYLNQIQTATDLYNKNVPYGIKQQTYKSPSTFMKIYGETNPMAGSHNQAKYGYTTNQTSMGQTMQDMMKMYGGQ